VGREVALAEGGAVAAGERAARILAVRQSLVLAVGPVVREEGTWSSSTLPAKTACRRARTDLEALAGRRLPRTGRCARKVLGREGADALRLLRDDLAIVEECLTRAAGDVGGREEYPRLVGAGAAVDGMRAVCRLLAEDRGMRSADRRARARRLGAAA
jgi:hypothetical protein